MADPRKLPTGKWQARYYDEAGKQHARNFDRQSEAKQWLKEVTASMVRGDYVDPKAGRIKLDTYAASWQAVQVSSDGTARIVDNALRLHILPELGAYPLAAIRPTMVQGLVKKLEAKGLAAGTIHGIFHVLTQVMVAAVEDRLISASPCRRITLPRLDEDEVVPPTVKQVEAFCEALPDRYRAVAVLLAGAGPRIGEALGLDVAHVEFLRRDVRVERQRRQDGTLGALKTKKARRTVPVGQVVIDSLAAHLAAYPSDGALFIDELGQPLAYRRWRSLAEAAVREANRRQAAELKKRDPKAKHVAWDLTAHDLRHFYASALISGGASVKQVQERLGHATPIITLEVYGHLWPGDDDRTRDVMDAVLAGLGSREDSGRTEDAADG